MTQTLALLQDSYRQLNSQKLFWLTLFLSGLVVAGFASIGIDKNGISLLWFEVGDFGAGINSDLIPPDQLYKRIFANFGISFWLAWLATILALVSTAGMIPQFIASGAIELTLSKPIGRVRLFLTKFGVGLLFTTLQVAIFTTACFLVIGFRGKSWEPGVFLAIPLVVLFYSYLYSVCVLLGLITRSTIASLLLTLLFWLFLFGLNATDGIMLQLREVNAMRIEQLTTRIERLEAVAIKGITEDRARARREAAEGIRDAEAPPLGEGEPTREEIEQRDSRIAKMRTDLAKAKERAPQWQFWTRVVVAAKTVFPKTSETVSLLERRLLKDLNLKGDDEETARDPGNVISMGNMSRADQRQLTQRIEKVIKSRSVAWVIGTSIGFELVVLGIASWVFARRDF